MQRLTRRHSLDPALTVNVEEKVTQHVDALEEAFEGFECEWL